MAALVALCWLVALFVLGVNHQRSFVVSAVDLGVTVVADDAEAVSELSHVVAGLTPQQKTDLLKRLAPSMSSTLGGGAHGGDDLKAAGADDMDCTCGKFDCKCQKNCFCSIKPAMFQGRRLELQHGPLPGLSLSSGQPTPNYKCTCDMTHVGGPEMTAEGVMDCDCAVAQCDCFRRCTCNP